MKMMICLVCLFLLSACGATTSSYTNRDIYIPYNAKNGFSASRTGSSGRLYVPLKKCTEPGRLTLMPPLRPFSSRPSDIQMHRNRIMYYNLEVMNYNRKVQDYKRCISQH